MLSAGPGGATPLGQQPDAMSEMMKKMQEKMQKKLMSQAKKASATAEGVENMNKAIEE